MFTRVPFQFTEAGIRDLVPGSELQVPGSWVLGFLGEKVNFYFESKLKIVKFK